ncbi:hypothetical protein [Blautia sp.]|uniref:hypothetical protein n=1 Tax=Blautia sp. TaxID=1955243 RepID=UPI00351F96B1
MNKKTYFERQKNRYKEGEFRWCTQTVLQQHKENCRQIMRIADEAVRLEFLFDLPWDMERTYKIEKFQYPIDWTYMPTDDSEFVERFPELSLFYRLFSPLNSEMICIFPYFCPYAESAREIREIFS